MFDKLEGQPSLLLRDETRTLDLGKALAKAMQPGTIVFLAGELGAGKTSCVRGILRGFGFEGPVKSPTYTLVEEYEFPWGMLYHFDLYRLKNPEELSFMGFRDYMDESNIIVLEWPEKGLAFLPQPDLLLHFSIAKENPNQRNVEIKAKTPMGQTIVNRVKELMESENDSDSITEKNGKSS